MALSEDFLYQLRQSNDINDVMASYVTMKKAGRDNVCLCPFHNEKTPSCHIYTETQSFYCFGCGAGGDAITFIRMIENLDYMESVRFLAQRAGLAMPEDGGDLVSQRKARLLEMNRAAGRFFHELLFAPVGQKGLLYLIDRGLTEKTIKKFGLGYADAEWHTLHKHLKDKGFTEDEMISGALLSTGKNKVFDKFRDRVMFPIIDRRGNIIGFGGRALEKDAMAKYMNSDETLVFQKRNNLYNLNYAKNTREKYFILCEGYMDVISVYQAGFHSAVATLGTAITSEQARLMRQYTEEVIIAYDADEAGQKATLKAMNLLSENGVTARVLSMNDAKDPDEFIKRFGADAFRMLLEKSGTAIEFELKKLLNTVDIDTTEGKATYLRKAVYILADIQNPLDRAVYISHTAKLTEVSPANIEQGVQNLIASRKWKSQLDERKSLISATPVRDKINPEAAQFPVEAKAERGIIAYLFKNPEHYEKVTSRLQIEDFPTSFHRKVLESMINLIKNGHNADLAELGKEFLAMEMGKITGIINEFRQLPTDNVVLNDYLSVIEKYKMSEQAKHVKDMDNDDLLQLAKKLAEGKK